MSFLMGFISKNESDSLFCFDAIPLLFLFK